MSEFLKEDEITEIFAEYLSQNGWKISTRAKGNSPGADIVAHMNGKSLCVEAKGGGSQVKTSKRFGKAFTRLQCQHHTDVAFACIPRMVFRYNPDFVGIVLHDDMHHRKSLQEILPAVSQLKAGAWLVGEEGVKVLIEPSYLKQL